MDVVPFEKENLLRLDVRFVGFGFWGEVSDEEGEVGVVNKEGEVESGERFGSGGEPGFGKVPEEEGVVGEFLGTGFVPGLEVEVEGGVVVEVDVKGATQHGA